MKLKHSLSIFGLVAMLGLGVGVGLARENAPKAAEAVSAGGTLYLDVSSITWWNGEEAETYANFTSSKGNTVPGTKMTSVSTYVYSVTIPADVTYVYFNRVKPADHTTIWNSSGGSSKPLEVPSNLATANAWAPIADTTTWADVQGNASAGSWKVYENVADGTYLRGAWTNGWDTAGQRAMNVVTEGTKFSIDNVSLGAGGQVKMVIYSGGYLTSWAQPNNVTCTNSAEYPVTKPDDGMGGYNVQVTNAGVYSLVITQSGDKWNYEFTGSSPAEYTAAVDFCDDFEDSMGLYCPNAGSDSEHKGLAKLISEWSAFKTRYDNADFADSRAYLTDENPTDDTFIEFKARYRAILRDYWDSLSSYNFLNIARPVSSINVPTFEADNNAMNNTAIIVIVASALTVALVAGGYFFLRKRKEDR